MESGNENSTNKEPANKEPANKEPAIEKPTNENPASTLITMEWITFPISVVLKTEQKSQILRVGDFITHAGREKQNDPNGVLISRFHGDSNTPGPVIIVYEAWRSAEGRWASSYNKDHAFLTPNSSLGTHRGQSIDYNTLKNINHLIPKNNKVFNNKVIEVIYDAIKGTFQQPSRSLMSRLNPFKKTGGYKKVYSIKRSNKKNKTRKYK
jgi:hypothetical protein